MDPESERSGKSRPPTIDLAGVLPVDKPPGPTSHDVVAAARRALGIRRIGHTGTLDPFASGLLLLCIGPATRLAEFLTPLPKRYFATMRLGTTTDTDDLKGEVVARSEAWTRLDEAAIRHVLEEQIGIREQLPPRYSAKKVSGERMYAVARRGGEVERSPVTVTIHALQVLDVRLPDVDFSVECSAGTYIRAIARDAGESLGVGAHLHALRRTGSGGFDVADALPLDSLSDRDRVGGALVAPAAAVRHLPHVVVPASDVRAVTHGRSVTVADPVPTGTAVALLSEEGTLLAVAEMVGQALHPRKVFA
jgi:tRNA pseudouridine55 synthase